MDACAFDLAQTYATDSERKACARELAHFRGCPKCQDFDAAYWGLSDDDPYFSEHMDILRENGAIVPKAMYKVTRWERPIVPYLQWKLDCRGTDENENLALYLQEWRDRPTVVTYELGEQLWVNPGLIWRMALV